jgi:hypothetical protein
MAVIFAKAFLKVKLIYSKREHLMLNTIFFPMFIQTLNSCKITLDSESLFRKKNDFLYLSLGIKKETLTFSFITNYHFNCHSIDNFKLFCKFIKFMLNLA